MPDAPIASDDFESLYRSGEKAGASLAVGLGFCMARDAVARWLIAIGLTPNRATAAGLLATCGAGVCFAVGAGHHAPYEAGAGEAAGTWWPLSAGVLLFLAGAFDMLDGAIARIGKMRSAFGAVLDSALDRFSDMAVYLGCALYFGLHGNLTYNVLAILALCNAYMISYVKARAEDLIEDCSVGYWLRGERFGALMIAAMASHMPAALWQQAVLPFFTVLRRLRYARQALRAQRAGASPPQRGPIAGSLRFVALWRFPRGSVPYDVVAGLNIAFLILAPWLCPFFSGHSDPLRDLFRALLS